MAQDALGFQLDSFCVVPNSVPLLTCVSFKVMLIRYERNANADLLKSMEYVFIVLH